MKSTLASDVIDELLCQASMLKYRLRKRMRIRGKSCAVSIKVKIVEDLRLIRILICTWNWLVETFVECPESMNSSTVPE